MEDVLAGSLLTVRAEAIAAELHEGQTDRAGAPYIVHVVDVAERLFAAEADYEVIAAGFLHDTLEDTSATADYLRSQKIPERTIAAVEAVTRRDSETYAEFIERVAAAGPDAITVKLADLASNLSAARLDGLSETLRERYEKARARLISAQERGA